jgi:PAS domain S-box-containing protein
VPPEESSVSGPSDQRFRLLIEGISDYAIYMLDPTGVVISWNLGAQQFKGYSEQEIIGQHFSRFYTDEDRAIGLPATALETARREGRFEQEGWRVRKDGSHMWAHVVIDPIRDMAGDFIGFAKITRDITERKAAQEKLRRSEERFRLLVQGVTDYAIYMLSPEGIVSNWNAGAQRFKGYTEAEIVGQHFSRFYTEEDRRTGLPARALQTALREGRFEQEGWRVRKDGSRMWAHVVIDRIRDDRGELVGYAKITRDITQQREAQQKLEATRAALFQSQKQETIGQLSGGIAHDFNNILAIILGNLELIGKRMPREPTLQRLVDNSMEAARRGAALTKRLLAFARRQELRLEAIDVPDLIRNMAEMVQRSLGPGIQIETRFPLQLPPALVDANQLELAILNLLVNARDAMPDGGMVVVGARQEAIDVTSASGLESGGYIVVSVADTGEGMDPEVLQKAIEPFFTTKGVGKGTGLGLSMVHGLAQQSGGRLVLKSRQGEGTTAEIWLPRAQLGRLAETRRPIEKPAPSDVAVSPLLVIVVDDDPLVLMNTAAMLEDLGHRVIEATSGEEALTELQRTEAVDLVITDQLMPNMTGTELIAAIRACGSTVPVVLATGYAELPPGSDASLPRLNKPFAQADLADLVERVVSGEHARQVLPFRHKQS